MFINLLKKISIVIIVILFFYVPWARASFEDSYKELDDYFDENYQSVVIINNSIKTNSNTGGNIAQSGEIINGESESNIKVRTIINGEVVEDFEKREKSNKEKQGIIYDSKIEVIDNKVKIESKKEVNGEVEEIKKEFDLGDNKIKEVNKASTKIVEAQIKEESSPEITVPEVDRADVENEGQKEETLSIFRYINIILDILKNNIDRISKLF